MRNIRGPLVQKQDFSVFYCPAEEQSGSIGRELDLGQGDASLRSPKPLCSVLEQDTLSSA